MDPRWESDQIVLYDGLNVHRVKDALKTEQKQVRGQQAAGCLLYGNDWFRVCIRPASKISNASAWQCRNSPHTTSVIFLNDSEELRLQPIFANSSENVSGLGSNLTPRKGQSADNPWQRHGSTPPKEPRPVRAPSPFGSIPNSASSWGALTGLTVYHGPNPWRSHGLRVACPFGAKRLRLKRKGGMRVSAEP